MKWLNLALVFLICSNIARAQGRSGQAFTDSLLSTLPKLQEDSLKVKVLNSLSYEYRRISPDTGLLFAQQALSLANLVNFTSGAAQALRFGGINLYRLSDYPTAMEWHQKAASLFKQVNDQEGQAANFNNIGNVWLAQADYPRPWIGTKRHLPSTNALATCKNLPTT